MDLLVSNTPVLSLSSGDSWHLLDRSVGSWVKGIDPRYLPLLYAAVTYEFTLGPPSLKIS